jgi:hypothetical protein
LTHPVGDAVVVLRARAPKAAVHGATAAVTAVISVLPLIA